MKKIFLLAVCLAISGCATNASTSLIVSGDTLLIQGSISDATAEQFKHAVDQGDISRVLVASGGGLVEPAIAIANEIHKRRMDVEVVGNCFSSCANYIFPAGANKTISGLGIVAWHGNMSHMLHMHAVGSKPLDAETLKEVQRLHELESAFFASVGLDQFICWFAKLEPYNARNLYFLGAEDMARFGIANVKVRPDYEKTDVSAHNANGVVNLQFIKVDWEKLLRPNMGK
jgi:hypothetical protein